VVTNAEDIVRLMEPIHNTGRDEFLERNDVHLAASRAESVPRL
jgi:hypothetical protein